MHPASAGEGSQREPTPSTGARIGPYRLVRRVGRGGMAAVWLAHDERLDRPVALKLLGDAWDPTDRAGRAPDEARARFLAEARAAARLDHPHVAPVYDVGEAADGRLYIAMAYCEGGSLADRLASGPLTVADALRVARQLAEAIAAAHARGVVHRDVKPANVLFDAAGQVRLADFGIAKLAGNDAAHGGRTQAGVIVGTPAYLAPEQVCGEPVDHRADLWALGVTLYEMLAGARPFGSASADPSYAAVLQAIVTATPAPLATRVRGLPDAVDALVRALLEKEPVLRPASADEVARLLASIDAATTPASGVALPTVAATGVVAALPAPLTPLVGRERELATAAALLGRARLVTLTGPGGTGKTRLALELARAVASHHPDGVAVVLLATVASGAHVPAAVAQAVGLREVGTLRPDEQAALYFARRDALLVLDNFEHVLDAAPFVGALLAAAPGLTVLVTSRAPLRLQAEHELPVPPLALPDVAATTADAIAHAEAVELFVQRARAGRPDFALGDDNAADVAALCRRLDGLPLAIELAAARVRVLSPRAILARLEHRFELLRSDARDVEPRHRTLRDVIDWSHALLAPEEQALFRRLSPFVGGFTLDAAAEVAGDGAAADPLAVLERIASLAEKSLLVRRDQPDGEPRFDMLETVREYGRARLRESGEEAAVHAAHRAHFLALAEEAARHLRGPSQGVWLERLEREHDNLGAALDDAQAADDVASAARLGIALHRYWVVTRRSVGDALARLQALDERIRRGPGEPLPAETYARLLNALGLLTGIRGRFTIARDHFDAARRAYAAAGDEEGLATTLNHLGWLSYLLGDLDVARAISREALAAHLARDNQLGVSLARVNLGWVALSRGELADAEREYSEALAIQRRIGERRSAAYTVSYVGAVAHRRGEFARAIACFDEALAVAVPLHDRVLGAATLVRRASAHFEATDGDAGDDPVEGRALPELREIGHPWSLGYALCHLGAVHRHAGDLDRARAALEESLVLRRGTEDVGGADETAALLADVHRLRGDRAASVAHWRESLRGRVGRGEALGVVQCLEGIAALALDADRPEATARLLGAADAARARMGAPLPPRYRGERAALLGALRDRLGTTRVEALRAGGAEMSPDALVRLAEAELDA